MKDDNTITRINGGNMEGIDKQLDNMCVVLKEIGSTTYVLEIRKSDADSLSLEDKLMNIVVERIMKAS